MGTLCGQEEKGIAGADFGGGKVFDPLSNTYCGP